MSEASPWADLTERAVRTFGTTEVPDGATAADAQDVLRKAARSSADEWRSQTDAVLGSARSDRQNFDSALRELWGPSLDELQMFIEAAEQFGADFVTSQPPDNRTPLTEALLTLHSAACACAHEVHWLLSGGYPTGADSRGRTLHEIAVTALVLADHGFDDPDLVQRFVDHRVVEDWKYWNFIAMHHTELGMEAPPPDVLDRLTKQIDARTSKYSKSFTQPFGWAIPLTPDGQLEGLEKLVHRYDRRPLFKLVSSTAVHANVRLLPRHRVERAGGFERLSNATVRGLGRPAAVAAHCLWDTCSAVVGGAMRSDSFTPPVALMTLGMLRDDVVRSVSQVDDPGR